MPLFCLLIYDAVVAYNVQKLHAARSVERLEKEKVMRVLKKLYYKIFKHYQVLETKFVSYQDGDKMIRETHDKPKAERWLLAKEEDSNKVIGMVYLCRKRRVASC